MQRDSSLFPQHQDNDVNEISSSCSDYHTTSSSNKQQGIKIIANDSSIPEEINQPMTDININTSSIKLDKIQFIINNIFLSLNLIQDEISTARNKPHSMNKLFNEIKLKLKFNSKLRKNKFDSIVKKTKARLFKVIHNTINKCFNNNVKVERLPQQFITDLQIKLNKEYLGETLFSCYQKFGIFTTYDKLIEDNSLKKDKIELFKRFTQLTFEEFFDYYITSELFWDEVYYLGDSIGVKFAVMYMFIMLNFVRYYKNGKGNVIKNKKTNDQL